MCRSGEGKVTRQQAVGLSFARDVHADTRDTPHRTRSVLTRLDLVEEATEDSEEKHVHGETEDLDWLASEGLNEGNGEEVAWEETGDGDDQVTGGCLHQLGPGVTGSEVDGGQDGGLVEVDAIEGNVDEEPAEGAAEEDLEVAPLAEVGDELVVRLLSDGTETNGNAAGVGSHGLNVTAGLLEGKLLLRVDAANDNALGGSLVEQLRVVLDGTSLGESSGLDHGQTEVEGDEGRDQGQTLENTPSTGELVDVASLDVVAVACNDNDTEDTGGQVTPTLVGEDPGKHGTTLLHVRTVRNDGSRHGVVTSDTNTHEDTEGGHPDGDAVSAKVVGSRDDQDDRDNDDDELLSVDGGSTQCVTEETEHELTDDVTDVGGCLEDTTLETPADVLGACRVVGV